MAENVAPETQGSAPLENQPLDGRFVHAWTVDLLSILDDTLPLATKKALLNGCASLHYNALNMDELVLQYRGDLAGFIAFLTEKWQWKVDYDAGARVITADENKLECVCPVARLSPNRVSGVLCHCSEGFAERMFSGVVNGPVKAQVIRSILRGDPSCLYRIHIL